MTANDLHALAEYNTDLLLGRMHNREHVGRMKLLQAEFDIERARRIGMVGDDWDVLRQLRTAEPGTCWSVRNV